MWPVVTSITSTASEVDEALSAGDPNTCAHKHYKAVLAVVRVVQARTPVWHHGTTTQRVIVCSLPTRCNTRRTNHTAHQSRHQHSASDCLVTLIPRTTPEAPLQRLGTVSLGHSTSDAAQPGCSTAGVQYRKVWYHHGPIQTALTTVERNPHNLHYAIYKKSPGPSPSQMQFEDWVCADQELQKCRTPHTTSCTRFRQTTCACAQ